jgi:hypothetical protein
LLLTAALKAADACKSGCNKCPLLQTTMGNVENPRRFIAKALLS